GATGQSPPVLRRARRALLLLRSRVAAVLLGERRAEGLIRRAAKRGGTAHPLGDLRLTSGDPRTHRCRRRASGGPPAGKGRADARGAAQSTEAQCRNLPILRRRTRTKRFERWRPPAPGRSAAGPICSCSFVPAARRRLPSSI